MSAKDRVLLERAPAPRARRRGSPRPPRSARDEIVVAVAAAGAVARRRRRTARSPSAATAGASGSPAVPDGLPDRRGDRPRRRRSRAARPIPTVTPAAAVRARAGPAPDARAERRDARPPRARRPPRPGLVPRARDARPPRVGARHARRRRRAPRASTRSPSGRAWARSSTAPAGRTEPLRAVLLGGYHGTWVDAATAAGLTLDRDALAAAGADVRRRRGRRPAAVGLPGRRGRPRREPGWPAQTAGQCGPCVHGLAAIADELAELTAGAPAAGRRLARLRALERPGRPAAAPAITPTASARFLLSALEVFEPEFELHRRFGPCEACVAPAGPAPPRARRCSRHEPRTCACTRSRAPGTGPALSCCPR